MVPAGKHCGNCKLTNGERSRGQAAGNSGGGVPRRQQQQHRGPGAGRVTSSTLHLQTRQAPHDCVHCAGWSS